MDSIGCAKQKIRAVIAGSKVPEDPHHAENTLKWLLRLDPKAAQSLQMAALAHDIGRAVDTRKVRRSEYDDYDVFKATHALNGGEILRKIMEECGVPKSIAEEACRLDLGVSHCGHWHGQRLPTTPLKGRQRESPAGIVVGKKRDRL